MHPIDDEELRSTATLQSTSDSPIHRRQPPDVDRVFSPAPAASDRRRSRRQPAPPGSDSLFRRLRQPDPTAPLPGDDAPLSDGHLLQFGDFPAATYDLDGLVIEFGTHGFDELDDPSPTNSPTSKVPSLGNDNPFWRWAISKFIESSVRWKLPLKKYDMIPNESFLQEASSCQPFFLPNDFYDKVENGSIVLKKTQKVSFCREGLILDGEKSPMKADIVILATGYKGDEKLKNIFASTTFQKWIQGSPNSIVPLYRQMIHPRIPQLAVIGYSESLSNLFIFEMWCKWLTFFLDQAFQLPSIKEMEKDIENWDKYMKKYAGNGKFRRSCIGGAQIWYIDQLCKDIGVNPRRKNGILSEFFQPYGIGDYKALGP
ncbi:hypothetical protein CASFOL_027018 [Castilleja foliolosa]|uniref:Flavin-containing monooxygenase n=1 Tax=Castilleja foliolosa TaxID=1961234 RepID=A0ABD3CIR3_9LAMI